MKEVLPAVSRCLGKCGCPRDGRRGFPYCSRGWRVQVDDASHVRSGRVDGRVQAESAGVHRKAGAALLHHLPQDVHLDLWHTRTRGSEEAPQMSKKKQFRPALRSVLELRGLSKPQFGWPSMAIRPKGCTVRKKPSPSLAASWKSKLSSTGEVVCCTSAPSTALDLPASHQTLLSMGNGCISSGLRRGAAGSLIC